MQLEEADSARQELEDYKAHASAHLQAQYLTIQKLQRTANTNVRW